MSFLKYAMTAAKLANCMAAENAEPGSRQPRMPGMTRRCAVLLIGNNSVMPWITPSTAICNHVSSTNPKSMSVGSVQDTFEPVIGFIAQE